MKILFKKQMLLAAIFVLLCGLVPSHASAMSAVNEGAKCPRLNAKVKVSKSVSFVCKSYGTRTKVLKWKRVVTATVPSVLPAAKIVIKGYSYAVATGINKSDVLSISNQDSVTHTVTFGSNANEGGSYSGYSIKESEVNPMANLVLFDVSVPGNSTAILSSLETGSYSFYCKLHSTMRGTLVIG